MKRIIKFRAWHEQKKVMFSAEEMGLDQLTILTDGRGFINVHGGNTELSILHPEMIPMQFTGLYDKDGKEIYEGDIIVFDVAEGRQDIEPAHNNQRGEVSISGGVTTFGQWTCLYCNNKRVIGNIYQNPELLSK